jgi:hypothetical protein
MDLNARSALLRRAGLRISVRQCVARTGADAGSWKPVLRRLVACAAQTRTRAQDATNMSAREMLRLANDYDELPNQRRRVSPRLFAL